MDHPGQILLELLALFSTRTQKFAPLLLLFLTACPSFYGQVSKVNKPEQPIQLTFVEGRSEELVLKIKTTQGAVAKATVLEVYRAFDDEPLLLQQIVLDAPMKDAVVNGIELVDVPGQFGTIEYIVATNSPDEQLTAGVMVNWEKPPTLPTNISAEYRLNAIVLSWKSGPGIVYRRNVIADTPLQEVGTGNGKFVDTEVRPGDVFTYQISRFRSSKTHRHFGPLSEPLYVTVGPEN